MAIKVQCPKCGAEKYTAYALARQPDGTLIRAYPISPRLLLLCICISSVFMALFVLLLVRGLNGARHSLVLWPLVLGFLASLIIEGVIYRFYSKSYHRPEFYRLVCKSCGHTWDWEREQPTKSNRVQ
jgi:predicted nucleic-acid-binding Zn-ribbon protein